MKNIDFFIAVAYNNRKKNEVIGMAIAAQAMRKKEVLKKEYSEKAATGALYDELSKGIESLKTGNVYTVDEAWEEIDKI